MPIIILQTSVSCSEEEKKSLAKQLSSLCAALLGKPETLVLSIVHDKVTLAFGGNFGRAALVDLRSVGGLSPAINTKITKEICDFLADNFSIEPTNVYVNFTDLADASCGWNRAVFS